MDSSNVHFFQDCQKCDKLKVWGIFINLPQRHILDEMSVLSKSLFYPLKKLSLSCILFCMTKKDCSLWQGIYQFL